MFPTRSAAFGNNPSSFFSRNCDYSINNYSTNYLISTIAANNFLHDSRTMKGAAIRFVNELFSLIGQNPSVYYHKVKYAISNKFFGNPYKHLSSPGTDPLDSPMWDPLISFMR